MNYDDGEKYDRQNLSVIGWEQNNVTCAKTGHSTVFIYDSVSCYIQG